MMYDSSLVPALNNTNVKVHESGTSNSHLLYFGIDCLATKGITELGTLLLLFGTGTNAQWMSEQGCLAAIGTASALAVAFYRQ